VQRQDARLGAPLSLRPTLRPAFGRLVHILWEAAVTMARRVGSYAQHRRNRRAVFSLAEWDDRMLKDIGLTRSEVLGALAARYHEDPSALVQRPARGRCLNAGRPGPAGSSGR
jgi:uncharacterized protein YjiS (DUF1127 family)